MSIFSQVFGEKKETPTKEETGKMDSVQKNENSSAQREEGNNDSVQKSVKEEDVLSFLKNKTGKDITSLDDLFKKEQSSFKAPKNQDVADFLSYHEQTGGSIEDFLYLKKDWSKIDDISVLREKIKRESDVNLTDKEIDILLKKELDIDEDVDFSELDNSEKLAIKVKAQRFRKELSQKNQEILQKFEKPSKEGDSKRSSEETVTLSNGMVVNKQEYLKEREIWDKNRNKAIKEVSETVFDIQLPNGNESYKFSYVYTDDDKQRMLSLTEDTGTIVERFVDEESHSFLHSDFGEAMLWADKKWREKAIQVILNQAISKVLENSIKEERNITFGSSRPQAPNKIKAGDNIDVSRLPRV
ncbi:hypothetical protein [Capnocytophaga canis]|uniref:hypothetical protein n=1 Tax=Capnocytophaga canis TaxID=1848903 RepID=UPI0037D5EA8B